MKEPRPEKENLANGPIGFKTDFGLTCVKTDAARTDQDAKKLLRSRSPRIDGKIPRHGRDQYTTCTVVCALAAIRSIRDELQL